MKSTFMQQPILNAAAIVVLMLQILVAGIAATPLIASAEEPATTAFERTWARTDAPVAHGSISRTWMWGPQAKTGAIDEDYADAPNGKRTVQYFDKSRMEDSSYNGATDPWDVTNGLLVVEMISGQLQTGDATFEAHEPANVNIAGDPGSQPTYASIASFGLRNKPATAVGATLKTWVDSSGIVTTSPSDPPAKVTAAERLTVEGIDHTVASVFWNFMTSTGVVQKNGNLAEEQLFLNPYYATGYPITEAYWSHVTIGGTPQTVLWQCFERRCLTYNPLNDAGWQVEAGNVGQHYYEWRYVNNSPVDMIPSQISSPTFDRVVKDPATGELQVQDELLVILSLNAPPEQILDISTKVGAEIIGSDPDLRLYQLRFPDVAPNVLIEKQSLLASMSSVVAATHHWISLVNLRVPHDAAYDSWDEDHPSGNNWGLEYIHAPSAWDMTTGSNWVRVAVIDSSFQKDHPDLTDNVDRWSWSAILEKPKDGTHGTHVSGTICASGDNSIGVTGVAWQCSLGLYNPIAFIDLSQQDPMAADSWAGIAETASMMRKATGDGARVVNMSLGFVDTNCFAFNVCGIPSNPEAYENLVREVNAILGRAIEQAAQQHDVLWIFAAGNESRDAKYQAPASLSTRFPNIITVASVGPSGQLSGFSNFGPSVTIAAPGENILSTTRPGSYGTLSGTSMAAPHVTGVAALVISQHPSLSAVEVKQCIMNGARSGNEQTKSIPILDAERAVQCESTPTNPLSLSAAGTSTTEITLTWDDKSNNEKGFKIYGSAGTFIGQVGANQTSFTVTGLGPNEQHCYQVTAWNDFDESAKSNVACATTKSAGPACSSDSGYWDANPHQAYPGDWITISGDGTEENGGWYEGLRVDFGIYDASETEYTLGYGIVECQGSRPLLQINVQLPSIMRSGSACIYSVHNGVWTGCMFIEVLSRETAPASPSGLTIGYDSSQESYFLAWQDNANNETGYEVWAGTYASGQIDTKIGTTGVDGWFHWLSWDYDLYFDCYQVIAYNSAGYSDWSNQVCWEATADPPATPTGLYIGYDSSQGSYFLGWQDNANNEEGYEAWAGTYQSGYIDTYLGDTGKDGWYYWLSSSEIEYDCYAVRAYNDGGYSEWSVATCWGDTAELNLTSQQSGSTAGGLPISNQIHGLRLPDLSAESS